MMEWKIWRVGTEVEGVQQDGGEAKAGTANRGFFFSLQVSIKYFGALSLTIDPPFFLIDIFNNTKFK